MQWRDNLVVGLSRGLDNYRMPSIFNLVTFDVWLSISQTQNRKLTDVLPRPELVSA